MFPISEFWTGDHSIALETLAASDQPWNVLDAIESIIDQYMATQDLASWTVLEGKIYLHPSAKIHPSATLTGPLIVGARTELRPGAYIRGQVIIGEDVVIGNSCEIKQAIIFNGAQVPHFNYVGDSILGYKAHLGAGVILSNYRADHGQVPIQFVDDLGQEVRTASGRRKLSAILGDHCEIGCNSVLNPGTIVGAHARVYPLSSVRGYVPPRHIYKNDGSLVPLEER